MKQLNDPLGCANPVIGNDPGVVAAAVGGYCGVCGSTGATHDGRCHAHCTDADCTRYHGWAQHPYQG